MARAPLPENARLRMALLAVLVGIIAALAAWGFRALIAIIHNLFFYQTLSLNYEANLHSDPSPLGAWVILVPVVGAWVVTYLVRSFAPEAKGHGVPEVIDAIYYRSSIIRPTVALVKSLASSVCIGTGGAVGREGPIIQIGAAFGSTVGQVIRMREWQRMVLVSCGVAGGIAATFNTPVGGLLFAVELTLVEVSARTLIPVALSTGAATFLGREFLGNQPAFDVPELAHPTLDLMAPQAFAVYVVLGLFLGVAAWIYIRGLYAFEDLFARMPGNDYARHSLGMFLVGLMMYAFMVQFDHYYVQGVGYATIQDILTGTLTNPYLLALLFVAKLVANGLTLGSGGSGGIFSPSLFLGATLGAFFGVLVDEFAPALHVNAANMAVVGMAGVVGSATGAVVTAVVMIFEMTRNYNVIVPLIITVSIAYGVRQWFMRDSIYTLKLTRRGHYIPDSQGTDIFMLRRAGDLMKKHLLIPKTDEPLGELRKRLPDPYLVPHVLLTDGDRIHAILSEERVQSLDPEGHAHTWTEEHLKTCFVVVAQEEKVFDAVAKMRAADCDLALVTKDGRLHHPQEVKGVLSLQHIARSSHLTRHILASEG
jgi:CIC family chloride channel protein